MRKFELANARPPPSSRAHRTRPLENPGVLRDDLPGVAGGGGRSPDHRGEVRDARRAYSGRASFHNFPEHLPRAIRALLGFAQGIPEIRRDARRNSPPGFRIRGTPGLSPTVTSRSADSGNCACIDRSGSRRTALPAGLRRVRCEGAGCFGVGSRSRVHRSCVVRWPPESLTDPRLLAAPEP